MRKNKVELLSVMGNDLTIVNAARVSFDKHSTRMDGRDRRLIEYLARHDHWTPFAHVQASFRIKAPLYVARQLHKHQIGLVVNEVSRRYVDSEPEFDIPTVWRLRADNVKQGSSGESLTASTSITESVTAYHARALHIYEHLLDQGVCPEQARTILPQSMLTEWVWTGSLVAFARVCKLRLACDTQLETRKVAEEIYNALDNEEGLVYSFPALMQTKQENNDV